MDGIPPALLAAGSWFGSTVVLYLALVKGWLVVGSVHTERVTDLRETIADQRETIDSLAESTAKLTASADLQVQLLRGIDEAARHKGGND